MDGGRSEAPALTLDPWVLWSGSVTPAKEPQDEDPTSKCSSGFLCTWSDYFSVNALFPKKVFPQAEFYWD